MGSFKEDCMHGFGCIFKDKKKVFEGEFVDSKMHGPGIFHFLNGNVFSGCFYNNERRGFGRFIINEKDSSVREIEAIFEKNDQMRVVGVILNKNQDKNLNILELRNRVLKKNNLEKVNSYTWQNINSLSKKYKVSSEKLREFEKKLINQRRMDSEEYDSDESCLTQPNGSDLGLDSMEDKSDRSVDSENSEYCDDFECFNSNWSNETQNKNKLCEKCMIKENLQDESDEDFMEEIHLNNRIQNTQSKLIFKRDHTDILSNEALRQLIDPREMEELQRYSREEINKVKVIR